MNFEPMEASEEWGRYDEGLGYVSLMVVRTSIFRRDVDPSSDARWPRSLRRVSNLRQKPY